jgi:hypothetical protein
MGIPGNEQENEEANAPLDDDIQQNEEYPPKRSRKMVKNRNELPPRYMASPPLTRATHGQRMNGITEPQCPFCEIGLTVDHVLWDCTETEQTKREMMMTPEIWTRGAEGMKKTIEYTKK